MKQIALFILLSLSVNIFSQELDKKSMNDFLTNELTKNITGARIVQEGHFQEGSELYLSVIQIPEFYDFELFSMSFQKHIIDSFSDIEIIQSWRAEKTAEGVLSCICSVGDGADLFVCSFIESSTRVVITCVIENEE